MKWEPQYQRAGERCEAAGQSQACIILVKVKAVIFGKYNLVCVGGGGGVHGLTPTKYKVIPGKVLSLPKSGI